MPARTPSRSRWPRRAAVTGVAAALLTAALATPALAHVTVQADNPARRGSAIVTFKVPTESDTAATTKVELSLPTDPPLVDARPEPVPGWKLDIATVPLNPPVKSGDDTITDAVSRITWSANSKADGIPANAFGEFRVAVSQLPDAASVTFKAIQTYSDGQVTRWIGTQQAGEPEPDNPAPVLTLTAAGASAAPAAPGPATGSAAAPAADSSDGTARALGVTGIVLAVLLSAGAYLLGRRHGGAGSDRR